MNDAIDDVEANVDRLIKLCEHLTTELKTVFTVLRVLEFRINGLEEGVDILARRTGQVGKRAGPGGTGSHEH